MGFDYVVFIYVTVFFGLLFAIFTGIYFEPRFFHTSNYSKHYRCFVRRIHSYWFGIFYGFDV